mgnify:CR=1 FL=1
MKYCQVCTRKITNNNKRFCSIDCLRTHDGLHLTCRSKALVYICSICGGDLYKPMFKKQKSPILCWDCQMKKSQDEHDGKICSVCGVQAKNTKWNQVTDKCNKCYFHSYKYGNDLAKTSIALVDLKKELKEILNGN